MHDKALAIERARQEAARRELEAKEVEEGGFRPAATSVFRLPQMQLKGFALDSDGEPFALLEVTGSGTFVVRGEDTLSVQHTQGNLVLKVERIENRTVFVEVGTLGQTIVVR